MTPDQITEARALVERLHGFANGCRGSMWQSRDETILLMDEAAAALTAAQDEIERLREALQAGYDLIEGDATGADWKRGCRVFTGQARAALKGDDQ